ncbi:replication initiator [Dactylosporangium sp. NPDC000521]|uniref:replication initiator n=1 Tax=Dactylosporangium sp. NPDC000521 TaxID=3363975 RepID=UPI0036901E3A
MTLEPAALATLARSTEIRHQAIARAARPDYPAWVSHVRAASGCARPVRLAGTMSTVEAATGRLLSSADTAHMPDGVIYKACGNRRESACPSCSRTYKRDAYQVVRAGLVGGKGVPEYVAEHPAVFPTFTAPSFGEVHTRVVRRHTCDKRAKCDCRPDPCHARRDISVCAHGRRLVCFARHEPTDRVLGTPMCVDCYDPDAQVVWNLQSTELWRRTSEAIRKYVRRLADRRGIDPKSVRLAIGKAAEMQRRGVIHFHAIIRLDGTDPDFPGEILPPPAGIDAHDLVAAVEHAVRVTGFTTPPHPVKPDGWRMTWGEQLRTKVITVAADGDVTDGMVAAYLAKYATKATEVTGHTSARLTDTTVHVYADPDGSHTERLIDACWTLGGPRWPVQGPTCGGPCLHRSCTAILQPPPWRPTLSGPICRTNQAKGVCPHSSCAAVRVATTDPGAPWRRLRRWAHMLGFGGHFFTKSRTYSITFAVLRQNRIVHRRTETAGPQPDGQTPEQPTVLVVNFLQFVGAGWLSPADAMLANTSAAMAREHQQKAREYLTSIAA